MENMDMSSKNERKIAADIEKTLSPASRLTALQALKECAGIERLYREIKRPDGGVIHLSRDAYDSFRRLVDYVEKNAANKDFVGRNDVFRACKSVVGAACEDGVVKLSLQSFMKSVDLNLAVEIQDHRFYTSLDGLSFDDFEVLNIGSITIQKPDFKVLQDSEAYEQTRDSLWGKMGSALWITQQLSGSREECERRFFENVKSVCGLLSISLALDGEWGVIGRRLMPCMDGRSRPNSSSWFSIATKSRVLCASSTSNKSLLLPVREVVVTDLMSRDWFQNLTQIIQSNEPHDVEQAIRRGIYWYFDAQLDSSLEMQLVKFWSCIECIFSFLNNGQTTKSIKNGMTGMFILGGYRLVPLNEKAKLRRDIQRLYGLRCGAVHDAAHNHVTERDVAQMSKWAAWVMLEVAGLAAYGLKTREKVKIQTDYWYAQLSSHGSGSNLHPSG